jgi:hypothetical protein
MDTYIHVGSADDVVERSKAAGGSLLAGPLDARCCGGSARRPARFPGRLTGSLGKPDHAP